MVDMTLRSLLARNYLIFLVEDYVVVCWNVAIILVYAAAMLLPMLLILILQVFLGSRYLSFMCVAVNRLVKTALLVKRCARNSVILSVIISVLYLVTQVSFLCPFN